MGTVLQFAVPEGGAARKREARADGECRIVIFPGVRIERHDGGRRLDLGYRLRDSAGSDSFEGLGGGDRPRKLS